ncbi:protein ELYS homolog [Anastrepha obliqua]|uniref:protein ELYS homolog n=1 Tax=Anastrepha obliqua TaxID=95512 RepID=UPI002409DEC0|nr:protein ELYS homolog [Anastrepha obliqua]
MEWYEIAVDGERTVKFPSRTLQPDASQHQHQKHFQQRDIAAAAADEDCAVPQQLGGIIKRGAWSWLASGNALDITALRTGQTIATYEFTEILGYDNCCIRCVEELFPENTETVLLAVCLECFRAAGGGCSFVAIYSIEHGRVLSCIELSLHITAAAFVSGNCCRRSLLQNFDGCLSVGSEEGVILLLDLNIKKLLSACGERMGAPVGQLTDTITVCKIADYNLPLAEIHRTFRQTRQDDAHFGLQIEVIDTPCAVQCLLPIDVSLGLAIGLEDGRLAFYDLAEMQIFHIAIPQPMYVMAPVMKLSYLEPLDDPRHCLYVWAMHENGENLNAVLHTLIYEKRLMEKDGFYYFESFLTCIPRLQLPLESTKSVAIGCQSISKIQNSSFNISLGSGLNATLADEDGYCLSALTWYSTLEEKNKLLIFDLNQWYKEEMPNSFMNQKCPNYLAGYVLSGRQCALGAFLNPSTIAHFNSLQRFEEHFYPNSLSFDCVLLLEDSTLGYTWIGAQNKIINVLRASNSSIFLEPDMYFREILRARLLPQFSELNVDSTFSRLAIYETILCVALEHNCFSLLRDCAKCWADGSFMGSNFTATTGISLSTLTDWIWKRATEIKTRCNDLSKGLFDYAGYPLDPREQKELGYLTRQLKLLADLLGEVLSTGKRYIPDKVFLNLETQNKSMRMASEYQDVLLWLLNIRLLPEMQHNRNNHNSYKEHSKAKEDINFIQYPYDDLKNLYTRRRAFFARINENLISKKTGSCRLLFIDALITHECKGDVLRECWLENGGNGLYPPPSIEAMLRVMLVPDVEFESKCAILLYFFLDLHMTIDEHAHKEVVESFVKFPSVFKLTAALIKTVQSLWNLDHGLFMPAVDEFISPFNNNQTYTQWMLELLIESLLSQNAADFALRILEARSTLISPVLKLKTLLANDLISEAFHFSRSKQDDSLLELFFKCCLCAGKYGVIRDLALSEREGQLVQRILRTSKTHGAENLHFVYLLQKSKYIEAVSYLDELSRAKSLRMNYGNEGIVVDSADTPNLVLSAFNTTMAPVTQGLTDVYFRIKNKIKKKEADNHSPVPLSCQLIKQNANNLLGGIYHSSALSAHFATYYWGEMGDERQRNVASASALLSANNAPFLRKPQVETCHLHMKQSAQSGVSYPQPYRLTEKRTLAEREMELDDATGKVSTALNTIAQPRKRRRLLGQEIIKDLGHFMQINKTASQLTAHGFDMQTAYKPEENTNELTPQKMPAASTEFLTQPLITPRRRLNALDESRSVGLSTTTISELHSILKTSNTPERTERGYSARRELHSAIDESKNLRFKLPATEIVEDSPAKLKHGDAKINTDIGKRRLVSTTTIIDEADKNVAKDEMPHATAETPNEIAQEDIELAEDEAIDELLIEVRHEIPSSATSSPANQKVVMQVVSGEPDSSKRIQVLEEEEEAEDFYSPLSSRNNSLIIEGVRSPITSTTTTFASSDYESKTSKVFRFSGPQPRKPLARLSAERSQSRTPEKQMPERKEEKEENQQSPGCVEKQSSSRHASVTSSGYSTAVTNAVDCRKPSFQIKSVMSLASSDFAPYSSSSKISSTLSKFNLQDTTVQEQRGKLSECSTVVGSFSVEESRFPGTDEIDNMEKPTAAYIQLKRTASEFVRPTTVQHLHANTTLDMSSYEFTLAEDGAKQKAAVLKSMETDELMNMDEDVEPEIEEINVNKEQLVPKFNAKSNDYVTAPAETDLYSDALGITVQHATDVDIEESEDSNDVVALLNNPEAAVEKLKNQTAADESDSDVIILSSSASSPQMHVDNQQFDSDSESDNDESEEGGEEEDVSYVHYTHKPNSAGNLSDSSSIEVIEESHSDGSDRSGSGEMTRKSILRTNILQEEREAYVHAPVNENDFEESNTGENTQHTKKEKSKKENITDIQSDSKDSYSNSASVENEERIEVEEAASSCADYEELVLRETVVFEESEDEQQADEDNQEAGSYFSKSVFVQNDAKITIEELKVNAYNATSQEIYVELGSDVFYCDAETTSESVEMYGKCDDEINVVVASTSKKILTHTVNLTAKLPEELLQGVEKPKLNEKVSTHSIIDKDIIEEHKKVNKNIGSDVAATVANKRPIFATASPEGKNKYRIEESEEEKQISLSVGEKEDTKKAEQCLQEEGQISMRGNEGEDIEKTKIEEPEEEDQISLHVDECDLSEVELLEVDENGKNPTTEKQSTVKSTSKTAEEDLEESSQKPQSPKSHLLSERESKSELRNSPQNDSKLLEKSLRSSQISVPGEKACLKREYSTLNTLLEEGETITISSIPKNTRYSHRGTSVPPLVDLTASPAFDEIITPRRNTRGISMPPQTTAQQEQEASVHTPERSTSSRRSNRASSAQPSEEMIALLGTPRTRRSSRGVSMPHDVDENDSFMRLRTARGTSVPPATKIVARRRSTLLDPVDENTPVLDSPSTRTRSRMRLNSTESELNSSIVSGSEQAPQSKRKRRSSITSNVSEHQTTPSSRRTRRSNAAAESEITTSEAGSPKTPVRRTRRQSTNAENLDAMTSIDKNEHETQESTNTNENATEEVLYSSARRLTRTQLAIMEKSAVLRKIKPVEGLHSGTSKSSPTTKGARKRRSSRSTVPDSDDVESISSHRSNISGTQKRRVTRSSVKDKEENDDDLVSVGSSVGSERLYMLRSKEPKSSPNTTLGTILEDEGEEAGPKKRSMPIKKRLSKSHGEPSP